MFVLYLRRGEEGGPGFQNKHPAVVLISPPRSVLDGVKLPLEEDRYWRPRSVLICEPV